MSGRGYWADIDNAQASMSNLDHARAERDGFVVGKSAVHTSVMGIGHLFGRAARLSIEEPLEHLEERAHDAIRLYEAAVAERDERVDRLFTELADVKALLTEAVNETSARYAKARKPLPEWAATAAGRILRDGEPF